MLKNTNATIHIYNQTCKLVCNPKYVISLRNRTKIRAKGYFWSPMYRDGRWDGFVKYITDAGNFSTGLLDEMVKHLVDMGVTVTFEDHRKPFVPKNQIDELGNFELRSYQLKAKQAVINHKLFGLSFPRGILNEATNAGKTLIAMGIYSSYHNKRVGLFLVNNQLLFNQAVSDFTETLGKDQVGWVASKKGVKISRVNVCMVQTLGLRIKRDPKLRAMVNNADIVIVDEADEIIGRKDCKEILKTAHDATVRVAITGTALLSKDKNRNQSLIAYFGPLLHQTTNKELVEMGVSTKPDIRVYAGNKEKSEEVYAEEYEAAITKNRKRHRRIWNIVEKFDAKNRGPFLILFKYHKHGKRLLKACPEELLKKHRVELAHGKVGSRQSILDEFNKGKIHILLCSFIIKRGKNLPLIKTLINAAGGDSHENVLQIFGRALRSHKTKKKVYMIDLWDSGKYLARHSKHRVIYYANQGFEVKELHHGAKRKKLLNNRNNGKNKTKGQK